MTAPLKLTAAAILRKTPGGPAALALRALWHRSFLREAGWFESHARSMPVDAAGGAIPWYTYGAIRFLAPRLQPSMAVFEYGSGNSTLWWAARAQRVVSCEHDSQWHSEMRGRLPPHVEYEYCALEPEGAYAARISRHRGEFDVVVIDGRDRVNCATHAIAALKDDGVVVWDNSDRAEYQAGYDFLSAQGFRRIDFWGMGPINGYGWCTSVFYRPHNCLGI
jgi:hypothetical protein